MKVTVVGGGNIGTQFAVHFAEKGHDVMIFTSNPQVFETHLCIVNDEGTIIHEGDIRMATDDERTAFSSRDLILITYPSNYMRKAADAMRPYVNKETVIGAIPGNGGSECVFREFIENGSTFFLLERVPSVARLVRRGCSVRCTGYRNELHLSALPRAKAGECSALIQSVFDIECKTIPYLLNMSLTPSNPILHTSRMRVIFSDYKPGVYYDRVPLFYEEWNDESSDLLMKCDDEVQAICKALPEQHLNYVKSLRDHYESYTVEAMTAKLSGIASLKGITTPSVEINGRYIPDLHSRYFTADFSYGLALIRQVAEFAGVSTPNIDEVSDWYDRIKLENNSFSYRDYGIVDKESFDRFYLG